MKRLIRQKKKTGLIKGGGGKEGGKCTMKKERYLQTQYYKNNTKIL